MSTVPDAWDDDWVAQADSTQKQQPVALPILSRAERKAQHAQQNRQIWASAQQDQPVNPYDLVKAKSEVPLASGFKPAITVLGRRPKPVPQTSLADEDDSEEEARKKNEATLAERQRKAQIEREEKQRRYAEARQRLFGPETGSSQDATTDSSYGTAPRKGQQQRKARAQNSPQTSKPASPAPQADARPVPVAHARLFDPLERTSSGGETERPFRATTPRDTIKPIRMPRGPDGSGKNGNGFVRADNTAR